MRIIWFQVITGLERSGVSVQSMAVHCAVTIQTIYNWRNGGEPKHYQGEMLRTLYERHVGLEAPVTTGEFVIRMDRKRPAEVLQSSLPTT